MNIYSSYQWCLLILFRSHAESGIQTLSQAFPESSASPITRRVIYDRLHSLLKHIFSLIPTLPATLQPLLVRHFPHKRQSQLTQTTYIRNILRVSSYCPELSENILATIVDRTIQIDVRGFTISGVVLIFPSGRNSGGARRPRRRGNKRRTASL